MTIEKCRSILGEAALALSDEEIARMVTEMESLAAIALDDYAAVSATPLDLSHFQQGDPDLIEDVFGISLLEDDLLPIPVEGTGTEGDTQ